MQIKNFLYLLLVKLLKSWLGAHTGDRFLVVSTTGLGDTLWGTPAIRALRKAYPSAYIAALTNPIGAEVLHNNPHLNEIFSIKNGWSLLKILPKLRTRQIATVFIFHTSQRSVLPFCSLLGATQLIGTANINKGLDALLTHRLPSSHIHEIERRLQIVGTPTEDKQMEIVPTSPSLHLPSPPVIGLHPGAKDRFKQWPPDHFIHLGQKLQKRYNCTLVITGTPAEKGLVDNISAAIPGAISLWNHLSIPAFAALLGQFSLFITNDTGPLHIACALQTPTIALFSPTNPQLCGPYFASHVRVLQKPPTCRPCLRKRCKEPFCLLQISPEEVFKLAQEILR